MNTYLVNEPNEYNKEVIRETSHVPDEVGYCYSFSNSLLDSNCRRFTIVIRIFGFVLKFIKNLKRRSRKLRSDDQYKSEIKNILLTGEEIEASQTFFFVKKHGILHYSKRTLPTEKIQAASEMTEVMKDLCSGTFCVIGI